MSRRHTAIAIGIATAILGSAAFAGPPQAARATSLPGNVADHSLVPTPTKVIRPGSWRDTNEKNMKATADAMVSSGLAGKGWDTIAVDDDWMIKDNGQDWDGTQVVPASQHGRDLDGNLISSPSKYPDGIADTITYVHSLGLKFGIYGDGGTLTCDGGSGNWGHFQQDMNFYASMGVDYIKMDYCNPYKQTSAKWPLNTTHDAQIAAKAARQAGQAIKRANAHYGTHMVLNLSAPAYFNWDNQQTGSAPFNDVMRGVAAGAQEARVGGDVGGASWAGILNNIDMDDQIGQYTRAGHFNDLDRVFLDEPGITQAQAQAQYTMWAMLSSPMVVKVPVDGSTIFPKKVVSDMSNARVLAITNDRLAARAKKIAGDSNAGIYAKPLANGDYAVALLNRSNKPQTLTTSGAQIGTSASSFALTNLWNGSVPKVGADGSFTVKVPKKSVVAFRLHATPTAQYSGYLFGPNGSTALNATSVTDNDAPTSGAINTAGDSLSSDSLAAAGVGSGQVLRIGGQKLTWPTMASGHFDSVQPSGQTIAYGHTGKKLGFLGVSGQGDRSGTLTLNYTDGSSTKVELGFPAFNTKHPNKFGDRTAFAYVGYNTQHGPSGTTARNVVSYAHVPVDPTKSLKSITLPNQPLLRIFAVTIS